MTLAVVSAPAHADGASVSSTVSSAAFNAAAGTLLIACIGCNTSNGGATGVTVTDNKGLTWTGLAWAGRPGQAQNGLAGIAMAWVPTAQTGIVVTVTTSGSTATTRRPSLDVFPVTGAHDTDPIATAVIGTNNGNAPSLSVATTVAGSLMVVCATDWQKWGAGTASGFDAVRNWDQAGADGVSGAAGYALQGAVGMWNYGLDAPGTSASNWNLARIEIRPALAPTVDAGTDVPSLAVGGTLARTATDTTGGSQITSRTWRIQSGPSGAGSTIGTAAALSWTPTVVGTYVLRYTATNAIGSTSDDVAVEVVDAPGVPFIPELPGGSVAVEVAWGADVNGDPALWVWDDVTADVRVDDGVSGSMGRNDEASSTSPAKVSLTLDNAAGRYSLGGQSPLWPNVRRNTPVRVTVDPADGTGARVVFVGYAVGFTPGWGSANGRAPVTRLEAAGILRRLKQGADPASSALYRYHTITEHPAEYWPLEEDQSATSARSAVGGEAATFVPINSGGQLYGKVGWGAADDNDAAARAVEVSAGGAVYLPFRPALFSNAGWTLTWSMRYVQSSGAFVRLVTDVATGFNYYFIFYTDGTVEMYGVQTGSSFVMLSWSMGQPYEWDGRWHSYTLRMSKPGTATTTQMFVDGVLKGTHTATPGTNGRPLQMQVISSPNPSGVEDPVSVSHVAGWATTPAYSGALEAATKAWVGERGDDRIVRLCSENRVPVTVTGAAPIAMGPQRPLTFLRLLDEVEATDQGILLDGLGPGLAYIAREERENAPVELEVSAADMRGAFAPVDDDQRNVNLSTASGRDGTKYTHEDADGPLGTAAIGVYDSSLDVNPADGSLVASYAAWQVHLGTIEGYRYPSAPLDMRAAPQLAGSVLAATPSTRISVSDVGTVFEGMPEGDVGLLVEGTSWSLSTFSWQVTLKCSPAGSWRIAKVSAATGDTDPEVFRLQADGAQLAAGVAAGATSLSVSTTSGPLWTTAADDFPFDLLVGGVRVTVTAITGGSSPQTFTVSPLPVARPAGTPVAVFEPPALGLG